MYDLIQITPVLALVVFNGMEPMPAHIYSRPQDDYISASIMFETGCEITCLSDTNQPGDEDFFAVDWAGRDEDDQPIWGHFDPTYIADLVMLLSAENFTMTEPVRRTITGWFTQR